MTATLSGAADPDLCPVGCGRKRKVGQLMDRLCWSKVPRDLKARVNETWRRRLADPTDHEARRAHEMACQNAIASIR